MAGDVRISGSTEVIAHLGYPTHTFTSPMIYNPWFARRRIDAVVVPMALRAADAPQVLPALARIPNLRGALVTMPLKSVVVDLLQEVSDRVRVAGSCNAVRRQPDGTLTGDLFDGVGFVRALARKGRSPAGARALLVGAGGVGAAIAASLAEEGIAGLRLVDPDVDAAEALATRLEVRHPDLAIEVSDAPEPAGMDIAINASPLGMHDDDPLPFAPEKVEPDAIVADVVLRGSTPLLAAARRRDLTVQAGVEMLFEQIPAYLDFLGFPAAGVEELRALAPDLPRD